MNRRTNVLITYDGVTLNTKEWEARTGIRARVILERLRSGWSAEDTLFIPVSPANAGGHRLPKESYYDQHYF
jgi:hypothetical protein